MFSLYDCWGTFMARWNDKDKALDAGEKFTNIGYKLHYVTDDEKNKVIWVGFTHPDDLKTVVDEVKKACAKIAHEYSDRAMRANPSAQEAAAAAKSIANVISER